MGEPNAQIPLSLEGLAYELQHGTGDKSGT
jgi:hypothetical protein